MATRNKTRLGCFKLEKNKYLKKKAITIASHRPSLKG